MKRFRAIEIAVLIATALIQQAGAQAQRETSADDADRRAIEQMHEREIAANLALDVSALASLWSDGMVSLPPGAPPLVGIDANIDFLQAGVKDMAQYDVMAYSQDWREVHQLGEYAFEWGVIAGRLKPPGGGEEISYQYKALRILKRQSDSSWKVYRTIWNEDGK